jgi:hypothetical protein
MTETEKAMQQIIFLRILLGYYKDEEAVKRLHNAELLDFTTQPKYLKSRNRTIQFDTYLAGYLTLRNPKPEEVLKTIQWMFEEWQYWPLLHQSAKSIIDSVKREMNLIKLGI